MAIHPSNLSILPDLCRDTSTHILSFLGKENISVIGRVAKNWRHLTTQDVLWQDIAFNRLGGIWS